MADIQTLKGGLDRLSSDIAKVTPDHNNAPG
jgi:hypothetical protein